MKRIYNFFEMLHYKLTIPLKGSSEKAIAIFAIIYLGGFIFVNIITILGLLELFKLIVFKINNGYEIIAINLFIYLILYLLFVRKDRYKVAKDKYEYLIWLYISLTTIVFFTSVIIKNN